MSRRSTAPGDFRRAGRGRGPASRPTKAPDAPRSSAGRVLRDKAEEREAKWARAIAEVWENDAGPGVLNQKRNPRRQFPTLAIEPVNPAGEPLFHRKIQQADA